MNIKFDKSWSFNIFLIKNYGFTTTRVDKSRALIQYIRKLNQESKEI